ncbi:MAG TPA: TonB-dependent siderophore receptor [Cyanobacteria bacterium UBA8803]|nr:TonB-dependent siderophore receptor [Cyanobacteria bacterium UBA9273]HBL57374.1 TonB-dependent siderophore receptor [Cyanobacteria bacterium UBA8803]
MKRQPLLSGLWLTGAVAVLVAQPVGAEAQQSVPIDEIPRLSELEFPKTSVQWLSQQQSMPTTIAGEQIAQVEENVVQITGVRLNPTDIGLEVILETVDGTSPQVITSSYDQILLLDITNARLSLPSGQEFRQDNPAQGITSVTVTPLYSNSVRVMVMGTGEAPTANVTRSNRGLVLSLNAPSTTAETPLTPDTPTPEVPEAEPLTTATPEDEPEAVTQEPQGEEEIEQELPEEEEIEIVVTGEQEDGYQTPDATTATRTDTPLRDIPQSIQVVPEQVLDDQQVVQLQDALRNVSGVTQGNTFGSGGDAFIIRGFPQFTILRNGFRESVENRSFRETANLERVEVLKGPASVLYGTLEPGGVINLVTKQPLSEPFYSAELQVGNFSFVRPSIDLSGPLNPERSLLYRLNAVYESGNDFRDTEQDSERFFISPVLTLQIGDRTDVTFELEYLNDERPFDRGLVAIGNEVADIPFDRVLGEPDDFSEREQFSVGYRLEHRFSENWTLRNAFQFLSNDANYLFIDTDSGLNESTGELTRSWADQEYTDRNYSFQTNLVGKVATGSVEHTLLFGVDLFRGTQDLDNWRQFDNVPSQNIFNPVYGFPRPSRDELPILVQLEGTTDILGIYLQDQMALTDNLKLLVGGRFDIVDQESNFKFSELGTLLDDTDSEQNEEAFTPRIGIVYQPIEPLSLYASYSQSFAPNSSTDANGSFLEPERGTQYEIGVKGDLLDGRLSATLAFFEITKSNVATTDPDNPDFSIAIGEQRSRGVELNLIGEITEGWNIIASYAYIDAEITKDNSPQEGNLLFGVPENSASLWTTYEIQRGNLQGLGFGLGLFFVGERQGDLANSFQVPSYVRTDVGVFYRRNNWQAALNIKNLFDIDYIESTGNDRARINPGAPFTIIGSVSVEF